MNRVFDEEPYISGLFVVYAGKKGDIEIFECLIISLINIYPKIYDTDTIGLKNMRHFNQNIRSPRIY